MNDGQRKVMFFVALIGREVRTGTMIVNGKLVDMKHFDRQ